MRSSSLDCSSGMKEVSKFRDDLYILRPLLNVKKEDIYDYALKNAAFIFFTSPIPDRSRRMRMSGTESRFV